MNPPNLNLAPYLEVSSKNLENYLICRPICRSQVFGISKLVINSLLVFGVSQSTNFILASIGGFVSGLHIRNLFFKTDFALIQILTFSFCEFILVITMYS